MNKDPESMSMDEAAEALNAFLNGSVEQPPVASDPTPAPEPTTATPDGETSTEGEVAPQNPDGNTQPTAQTAEPPATEQQPTPAPTGADPYEARFAKFEEELQRLRSENGRMRKIAAENAMLRRKVAQPNAPAEPPRARLDEFTEEQTFALGDEVTEALKTKLAQADQMLEAMDQRWQEQERYIGELKHRDFEAKHEAMMDAVEGQYGEGFWDLWETSQFKDWLDQRDPITGQNNGDLLRKIDSNADAPAAVALLGNFARSVGYSKPTATPVDTSTRNAPASANVAQRPAASHAMPNHPTSTKPQKRNWTQQDIDAAFVRADRDPAWANSKEGKAVFNEIMSLATSGFY